MSEYGFKKLKKKIIRQENEIEKSITWILRKKNAKLDL